MNPNNEAPCYCIYLLTVWKEGCAADLVQKEWRFRLEDPRTGTHRGFANGAALVAALTKGGWEEDDVVQRR